MKKSLFIILVSIFALFNAKAAIQVDSVRIILLNDTLYGVAIYGALMTCPAVIIDSSKQAQNDTIKLSLCYLHGDAGNNFCKGYDTVILGNIANTHQTIILALACTDTTTSSCANPNRKDTIVLQYFPTSIMNVESDYALQLFPNPASSIISGKVAWYAGATELQITNATGQLILQNIITQPSFTIDVNTLPTGLYFLQLTNGRQRVIRRFVKQ